MHLLPVLPGEATTLKHKTREPGVSAAFLAGDELTEVAGGFGDDIPLELELDTAGGACVDDDVELGNKFYAPG